MTIQELGEKFCLPVEKLKKYESCGLLPGEEMRTAQENTAMMISGFWD